MRERRESIASREFQGESPYLSVVIPAYNEAQRIPTTLHRLCDFLGGQEFRWEIVVVSNGSTDATGDVVRAAQEIEPRLHLVNIAERGKGIATKTGVLVARGEVVFLCDADLSMPPEMLSEFLTAVQDFDVVAGSREAPGAQRFGEPGHRHLMGRVFNFIVQLLAVPGMEDTQCGFKAFRRRAARDLFERGTVTGWGFDVEILYLARKLGYSIAEIPIDWYFDDDTRVQPGTDSMRMVGEVVAIRFRDLLGRYRRGASTPAGGDLVR